MTVASHWVASFASCTWKAENDVIGGTINTGEVATDRVENGQIHVGLSSLARRHSANHFSSVLDRLFAVERALFASESLADDARLPGEDEVLTGRIVRAVAAHGRREAKSV